MVKKWRFEGEVEDVEARYRQYKSGSLSAAGEPRPLGSELKGELMKKSGLLAAFTALVLSVWGCGHTVLQHSSGQDIPCSQNHVGPLPDLSIDGVIVQRSTVTGHTPERFPIHVTNFYFTIRNVGAAMFEGSLSIKSSYATSEGDVSSSPVLGPLQNAVLQVGDTTVVPVQLSGWYDPGTRFKFVLETDSNCFGCEPICEASYANNEVEFIIQ